MAKKDKYDWSTKPPVDLHTKVKHHIIHDYIKDYILTLTKVRTADEFRTSIYDCFCGGGVYKDGDKDHFGSPLQILSAVKNAESEILEQDRGKKLNLNINYFFSDSSESAIRSLKSHFEDYGYEGLEDVCRVATCNSVIDELITKAKNHTPRAGKAVFILDQYGYSDATVQDIAKIFEQLEKPEILLFLSVDKIIDFLNPKTSITQSLINSGYDIPVDELYELRKQSRISPTFKYKCRRELLNVYQQRLGPIFIHPFSIKNGVDGREYWFAHITRNWKAREVMLGIHRKYATHSVQYGLSGLDLSMMGYEEKKLFTQDLIGERTVDNLYRTLPEQLADELTRMISDKSWSGTQLDQLMFKTANGNPADRMCLNEAFDIMLSNNVIFQGRNGGKRRKGSSVANTDILLLPPQRSFTFGGM